MSTIDRTEYAIAQHLCTVDIDDHDLILRDDGDVIGHPLLKREMGLNDRLIFVDISQLSALVMDGLVDGIESQRVIYSIIFCESCEYCHLFVCQGFGFRVIILINLALDIKYHSGNQCA